MFLGNSDPSRTLRAREPGAEPDVKGLSKLSTGVIRGMAKSNLVSAGNQRDLDPRWAWTSC